MAYLSILASVPHERILAFQGDPDQSLKATMTRGVSHLIAYWVEVQPLGHLLGEIIDGGSTLHDSLWHPLRVPIFHDPAQTKELSAKLDGEWNHVTRLQEIAKDDWYRLESEKV